MTLVNKKNVRRLALDLAETKAHKFTQVSASFYELCESWMRNKIVEHVRSLPSKGKTIR